MICFLFKNPIVHDTLRSIDQSDKDKLIAVVHSSAGHTMEGYKMHLYFQLVLLMWRHQINYAGERMDHHIVPLINQRPDRRIGDYGF